MIKTSLNIFHNIIKNKSALICGSGPSLNTIDFEKISSTVVIFACNQSVTRMRHCSFFCFTDFAIIEKTDLFEYGCEIADQVMCFSDITPYVNTIPNYNKYKDKIFYIRRNINNQFNFTKTEELIFGVDVIHVTTHFAYLTGCNPLYLIGVDLTHVNNKKYCESIFFDKDLTWDDNAASIETLNLSYQYWVEIKNQNDILNIYNLSPCSKLISLYESRSTHDIYNV